MTPWRHGKGQRGRREGGREGKRTHGSGTWPRGPPTGALSPASKKPSYISDWLHCASWRDGEHVLVSSLSLSLSLFLSLTLSPRPDPSSPFTACVRSYFNKHSTPNSTSRGSTQLPLPYSRVIHLQNVWGEVMTTLNTFTFSFDPHIMK